MTSDTNYFTVPTAALEIAERGRARALVELLIQRAAVATDSKTDEPDKVRAPSASSVSPSAAQIQQIAKAQNATLIQYSIIYDDFKLDGKQQFKESALYIWMIKPTGEVTFRQTDLKPLWQQQNTSLSALVDQSRPAVAIRSRATLTVKLPPELQQQYTTQQTQRLQQLHQLLIEPIADLLPTHPNAHVIFIPQGSLFLVPFPALQAANGQYLIQQHTILTAPSIQVLDLTHQQRQKVQQAARQKVLVVGNPTMPIWHSLDGTQQQQLPPLLGAQQEAIAIANLFKTPVITGSQATKATVIPQMEQARFIHLATHGLLDDISGLGSAIALAPNGKDDGFLTAGEILNLHLNAELVVLSACDTGQGKLTGDGVIGLSRSLISAGVPSVMVSLWSIPDAPTASLMTQFYQNLQHNPDKAQALRQAMLSTMKDHPNPIDWAAFTLIGEAQ